jgi:hypothetical protein
MTTTTLNTPWAIGELNLFISRCQQHSTAWNQNSTAAFQNPALRTTHDDVIGQMPIIEQIADRAWPVWRQHMPERRGMSWEYDPLLQIAKQVLVMLYRKDELERNLGETGRTLSAQTLHRDVWEASKSLWRNGHYGEAVSAAARSVNAMLQAKVSRRNISEGKRVSECFSLDPPKPGFPACG